MAAARDEVEEEHQQALERAKQRRAGAHAEKRAWRERCVRPSGALSRVPADPAPHAPDPHVRPLLCGRRRRQLFCSRGAPAAEGVEARGGRGGVGTGSGRSRRSDRKAGRSPRQVASAGAGAVLSLPTARCWRARRALPVQARAGTGAQGPTSPPSSASAVSSSRRTGRSVRPPPVASPAPPARGVAP